MSRILMLARESDEIARDAYSGLAGMCQNDAEKAFWLTMARQENQHVRYWHRLEALGAEGRVPQVFEYPEAVVEELTLAAEKCRDLVQRVAEHYSVGQAFALAYRMEFYLLHPAFEMLFHVMGDSAGPGNPEKTYAQHIRAFMLGLSQFGKATPELELLSETVLRLWDQNKALATQALHDELTGLLNRRGFFSMALPMAHLAARNKSTVAVMMLDLDHFKSINDRFGHEAGDRVLRDTGKLLLSQLRASDLIARYGGEEFLVLLPGVEPAAVQPVAEKLRARFETDLPAGIPVTVSIGVAEGQAGRSPVEDLNRLIQSADAALYEAKRSGRNRVVVAGKMHTDSSHDTR